MPNARESADQQTASKAIQRLLESVLFGFAVLLAVHLAPKPMASHNSFRLLCTIGFFFSSIFLCWIFTIPREEAMRCYFSWRFEHAPQAIDRMWRRYLYSVDVFMRIVGALLGTFMSANAIYVLSLWYPGLSPLLGFSSILWGLSLTGIVLVPLLFSYLLEEIVQRRRKLNEQIAVMRWYAPKRLTDLWRTDDGSTHAPVEIIDSHTYRLGGQQWHWEDLLQSAIVFGKPGSGKTACVLHAWLDTLVRSGDPGQTAAGGLILDPKGVYHEKVTRLATRFGRSSDLVVLSPDDPQSTWRWNPWDSDDDALELAGRFTATMEALGTKNAESSFWMDYSRKLLRHCIQLLRCTNANGVPPSFQQIYELVTNPEAINQRLESLLESSSSAAANGPNVANSVAINAPVRSDAELQSTINFFQRDWAPLPDETRSGVLGLITNMIDPFLLEPYRTRFSGRSTVRIEDILQSGKILYIHLPSAEKEVMSRVIGTLIKLEYYREVLCQPRKAKRTFFFCDEFQVFFTSTLGKSDADFFERSRESNHANLVGVQNIQSLYKSSQNRANILNFLGNCGLKFFLRNDDAETNEFASKHFGKQIVAIGSANHGSGGQRWLSSLAVQEGSSDTEVSAVPPEQFLELMIPSKRDAIDYCEAIVYVGTRPQVQPGFVRQRWMLHLL